MGNLAATSTTPYQKATLTSAFLGWMFDSMDLNLFALVLFPSMSALLHTRNIHEIASAGSELIATKLFFWGIGGIMFGFVADKIGRSTTMMITILLYAVATGLSGFTETWWQLTSMQAIAALGIGGEWAAGSALVAESWPEEKRSRALLFTQTAYPAGFFLAALINLLLGPTSWRLVLAVGALPALMVLYFRRNVPEPERWVRAPKEPLISIFGPAFRSRIIVGIIIATAMMIGTWGARALLPSWIQQLVKENGGTNGVEIVSYAFMLLMGGTALGFTSLIWLAEIMGRRWLCFFCCLSGLVATLAMFLVVHDIRSLLWAIPVYGFFANGSFGILALYLPELFPTRFRATGQGICWNAARSITALGPLLFGVFLVSALGSIPLAAASTAIVYVAGMVAIWFGPETRGVPLTD